MAKGGGKNDQSGGHKKDIAKTDREINRMNKQPDMGANEKLRRLITGK